MNNYFPAYSTPQPYVQYVPYPTPETRDQFIRRLVADNYGVTSIDFLISDAKKIWDESMKVSK